MSKKVCGIDIGMEGGIVILNDDRIWKAIKMPIFEIEKGTGKKKKMQKQIDFQEIFNFLYPIVNENKDIEIYVEEVTHLFGLPSSSNFRLGYASGVVHGVLQALGEFYLIKPSQWQKVWQVWDKKFQRNKDGSLKLTPSGKEKLNTKATSLSAAKRIFPHDDFTIPGGKVPHSGIVDAALIAYQGSRM